MVLWPTWATPSQRVGGCFIFDGISAQWIYLPVVKAVSWCWSGFGRNRYIAKVLILRWVFSAREKECCPEMGLCGIMLPNHWKKSLVHAVIFWKGGEDLNLCLRIQCPKIISSGPKVSMRHNGQIMKPIPESCQNNRQKVESGYLSDQASLKNKVKLLLSHKLQISVSGKMTRANGGEITETIFAQDIKKKCLRTANVIRLNLELRQKGFDGRFGVLFWLMGLSVLIVLCLVWGSARLVFVHVRMAWHFLFPGELRLQPLVSVWSAKKFVSLLWFHFGGFSNLNSRTGKLSFLWH